MEEVFEMIEEVLKVKLTQLITLDELKVVTGIATSIEDSRMCKKRCQADIEMIEKRCQ